MLVITRGYGDSSAPPPAFTLDSITSSLRQLVLGFAESPTVSGPASDPTQYKIVALDGGCDATVTSVTAVGQTIVLGTTEHTIGKNYQLSIPYAGILGSYSEAFQGPFTADYVGAGDAPTAVMARSIDAYTAEIVFDEPVVEVEALDPTHYSISPTLKVSSVVKVTASVYRLTTVRQTQGTVYTVTVSGIHDLNGNLI